MPLHPQAQALCDLVERDPGARSRPKTVSTRPASVGVCSFAMAGGEPEPMFVVDDRDADGVPVRVYRPVARR